MYNEVTEVSQLQENNAIKNYVFPELMKIHEYIMSYI